MRTLTLGLVLLGSAACERSNGPAPEPSSAPSVAATSATPSAAPSVVASAPPAPSSSAPPVDAVTMPPPDEVKALAVGSNAFAFDLYARTAKAPGNQVFSPTSISIALAMTWAGAKGETAAQMQKVMHFSDAKAVATWGQLSRAMSLPSRPIKVRSANRLFGEKTYKFEQPFVDSTRAAFGAGLESADFKVGFDAARIHINGWVEEQTEKRIKDLLPVGALDKLTRLVLVNAIYFLADWAEPFSKNATSDAPFELSSGTKKPVPTMHAAGSFRLAAQDGVKVIELPYVGNDTSMLIVLPDAKAGLGAVEKAMSAAKLAAFSKALSPAYVEVALPRFELSPPTLPLTDSFKALGMQLAFDKKKADFTLIGNPPDPDEQLCVQSIFHKAFVKVDEKGTEAAAATAVVMGAKGGGAAPKAIEFRADHPFLFFIVDRASGLILFMGRVADPTAKG